MAEEESKSAATTGQGSVCSRCKETLDEHRISTVLKQVLPELYYLTKMMVVLAVVAIGSHINQLGDLSSQYAEKLSTGLDSKFLRTILQLYAGLWNRLHSFFGPILGLYSSVVYLPNVALVNVFSSSGVKNIREMVSDSPIKKLYDRYATDFLSDYVWVFVLCFSLVNGQSKVLTLMVMFVANVCWLLSEWNKGEKLFVHGEEITLSHQLHIFFAIANPFLIHAGILRVLLTALFYTLVPVGAHITYYTVLSCVNRKK